MTTLAANESPVQHAKAGSVTVKIYRGQNRGRPMFTLAWMVGERRFRRNFADERRAVRFAKTQAKDLSAGRVDASCISTTEAAEYRAAQRRLGEKAPIHVAAGEYASAVERLGEAGSLAQAVEFFLHNSMRPNMTRSVSQVVEEFIAAKQANGLSKTYIDDATWRLRRFKQVVIAVKHQRCKPEPHREMDHAILGHKSKTWQIHSAKRELIAFSKEAPWDQVAIRVCAEAKEFV